MFMIFVDDYGDLNVENCSINTNLFISVGNISKDMIDKNCKNKAKLWSHLTFRGNKLASDFIIHSFDSNTNLRIEKCVFEQRYFRASMFMIFVDGYGDLNVENCLINTKISIFLQKGISSFFDNICKNTADFNLMGNDNEMIVDENIFWDSSKFTNTHGAIVEFGANTCYKTVHFGNDNIENLKMKQNVFHRGITVNLNHSKGYGKILLILITILFLFMILFHYLNLF